MIQIDDYGRFSTTVLAVKCLPVRFQYPRNVCVLFVDVIREIILSLGAVPPPEPVMKPGMAACPGSEPSYTPEKGYELFPDQQIHRHKNLEAKENMWTST